MNNAGINMTGKDTHTVDEAFFDRLINLNLKSVYYSISSCAPMYVLCFLRQRLRAQLVSMLQQKSGVIHPYVVCWSPPSKAQDRLLYGHFSLLKSERC